VVIPANTTATVCIPAEDPAEIYEGGLPLAQKKEIKVEGNEDGYVIMTVGSGKYSFRRNR